MFSHLVKMVVEDRSPILLYEYRKSLCLPQAAVRRQRKRGTHRGAASITGIRRQEHTPVCSCAKRQRAGASRPAKAGVRKAQLCAEEDSSAQTAGVMRVVKGGYQKRGITSYRRRPRCSRRRNSPGRRCRPAGPAGRPGWDQSPGPGDWPAGRASRTACRRTGSAPRSPA